MAAACAVAFVMSLAAAFLLVRRLSGAFAASPSVAALLAVSLGAVLSASFAHALLRAPPSARSPAFIWFRGAVDLWLAVAVALLLAAVSLPYPSLLPVAAAWTIVLVPEILWIASPRFPALRARLDRRFARGPRVPSPPPSSVPPASRAVESLSSGETLRQQYVRKFTPDGETVQGTLRVDFAPGSLVEVCHVAFCPPFASPPKLELEVASHSPRITVQVAAKAVQVLAHGARIDIKRRGDASASLSVEIEFAAWSPHGGHSRSSAG